MQTPANTIYIKGHFISGTAGEGKGAADVDKVRQMIVYHEHVLNYLRKTKQKAWEIGTPIFLLLRKHKPNEIHLRRKQNR